MSSLPIVSATSELSAAQTPFHIPIKPALIGLGSLIALGGLCYCIKWLRQPDPYKKI